MSYQVEVTDTFAGEANYCWVRRYPMKERECSRLARVREAKSLAGYSGRRARVSDYDGDLRIDIVDACVVIFVTWVESEEP